jgi:DNA mismatch endonuclease (patch repair protein)
VTKEQRAAKRRHGPAEPLPPEPSVRRRMQATARRDTPPELALRRVLHGRGLRYRVDYPPIAGMRRRADIVFSKARVAVFVDGCFWHGCPVHGTLPKKNGSWWAAKLEANRMRDADTNARLGAAGWVVLRFWEHENPTIAAGQVVRTVRSRTADRRASRPD